MRDPIPPSHRFAAAQPPEAGFSLVEAIVATVIATVAVVGLAYTFGQGRSFIDRFQLRRDAFAVAQARMERLTFLDPEDPQLTLGIHPTSPIPFVLYGVSQGTESWRVQAVSDPTTGAANDLRRVTVTVTYSASVRPDSVNLERIFRSAGP